MLIVPRLSNCAHRRRRRARGSHPGAAFRVRHRAERLLRSSGARESRCARSGGSVAPGPGCACVPLLNTIATAQGSCPGVAELARAWGAVPTSTRTGPPDLHHRHVGQRLQRDSLGGHHQCGANNLLGDKLRSARFGRFIAQRMGSARLPSPGPPCCTWASCCRRARSASHPIARSRWCCGPARAGEGSPPSDRRAAALLKSAKDPVPGPAGGRLGRSGLGRASRSWAWTRPGVAAAAARAIATGRWTAVPAERGPRQGDCRGLSVALLRRWRTATVDPDRRGCSSAAPARRAGARRRARRRAGAYVQLEAAAPTAVAAGGGSRKL